MYKRKLTTVEHLFAYSPFSLVAVVTRIKGTVTPEQLKFAIPQISKKHILLQSKIINDSSGGLWFTTESVEDIPVKSINRTSDSHWMKVVEEESKIPFDFDKRPPIRFILIQSPEESELIILCHHIICDGISLAFLARDLMTALGNPKENFEPLPYPVPISFENFPADVSMSGIVKFFIKRMNKKWAANKVVFNQEDYEAINKAYWANFQHKIMCIELSESQTAALVKRCKAENVSVNSALTAAFVGAQIAVIGDHPGHDSIAIAGDLRNRLPNPPAEGLGFYAGAINLKIKYDSQKGFWENARQFHKKIKPKVTKKNLFKEPLTWLHLDPSIMTAINFKKLGGMTSKENAAGEKLHAFSKSKDVVMSIIKRDKMDSFDHKIMGTAVTNLTKMDFPKTYGDLELDRLIIHPGGAFPLSNVNMVVGAVTCSDKLSLVAEYEAGNFDGETIEKIKEEVMTVLSVRN